MTILRPLSVREGHALSLALNRHNFSLQMLGRNLDGLSDVSQLNIVLGERQIAVMSEPRDDLTLETRAVLDERYLTEEELDKLIDFIIRSFDRLSRDPFNNLLARGHRGLDLLLEGVDDREAIEQLF